MPGEAREPVSFINLLGDPGVEDQHKSGDCIRDSCCSGALVKNTEGRGRKAQARRARALYLIDADGRKDWTRAGDAG